MFDPTPALPEIFLALAALTLLVIGVVRQDDTAAELVTPLAVGALLVTLVVAVADGGTRAVTFAGQFVSDRFTTFLEVFILLGSAACLVMSPRFLRAAKTDRFEFAILVLFATLGMLMMVSANTLLALYVALELQSLSLYVLAAFQRDSAKSSEAGLKYFVLGALASGMLLYGCSLVYGFTGTIAFEPLAQLAAATAAGEETFATGALVGLVFIAAGLAFKISAVPFHMWTPDVYEGAPTPVTAFFAAAPKVAAMGLILRVFAQPFGDLVGQWQQIIIFISVASMLLGSFAAIGQTNIKRLMGYSSIGHVGYALVGLAAGTEEGVRAVLIYMAIYVVMTVGTFGVILACRRQEQPVETIEDFAGLAKQHPLLGLALAIFMFSLAGIPPLAGFFGKLYVFLAAVDAGLTPLAVIGLVTSVVSAYYYLRIVRVVYFDEQVSALDESVGRELGIVTGIAAVLTAGFCLYPSPLVEQAGAAAAALFG